MPRFRLRSISVLCMALAVGCARTVEDDGEGPGITPLESTETGNPPVIDVTRIAIVQREDAVHVVGEPGAIEPGGGEVQIEQPADGAMHTGPVAADGSFDVAVSGTLEDDYRVRVRGPSAASGDSAEAVVQGHATGRCEPCGVPSVSWRLPGDWQGNIETLTDCGTVTRSNDFGAPSCSYVLPCDSSGPVSGAAVHSAFSHPDVQAALAAGTIFNHVDSGYRGIIVSTPDGSFVYGKACEGAQACTPAPQAVADAAWLLSAVSESKPCESSTAVFGREECGLSFDPGTGADSVTAYAWDALLYTCRPQLYTGGGGNANRFVTAEDCREWCPTLVDRHCDLEQVETEDVCLECGPTGGCVLSVPRCAQSCEDASDCPEELGVCTSRGLCELAECG